MANLHIVHVVYECTPGIFRGGVQKVVLELAEAQLSLGANVEIWALNGDAGALVRTAGGVAIRSFSYSSFPGGVKGSRSLISALRAVVSNDLVVHAHNTFHPINIQVGRFARDNSVPVFYHTHGALDPKLFSGLSFKSIKKRAYNMLFEVRNLNRSCAIFALTELEASQLRSLGVRSQIVVVPNGVAPVSISSAVTPTWRQRLGISNASFVVLYMGRIVPKKAIDEIIDAFADVHRAEPSAKLIIAGDASQDAAYTDVLLRRISSNKISDAVHWIGFVNDSMKADLFLSSDVFVHASYSEGMAMAILEALAHGKPVVATAGCYMGEAARAGALLECDQGAVPLAEALLTVASSPRVKAELAVQALAYISCSHSWLKIAGTTISAYRAQGRCIQ